VWLQGTAFYALQSCVNHSCCPAARADADASGEAVLTAVRDIAAGRQAGHACPLHTAHMHCCCSRCSHHLLGTPHFGGFLLCTAVPVSTTACSAPHPTPASAAAAGEEVTISYIHEEALDLQGRRAALEGYGFTCACEQCAAEVLAAELAAA
jgi:hypothetical protein